MNRTFNIIMWGTACVLILGFIILIASMIVELGQEGKTQPLSGEKNKGGHMGTKYHHFFEIKKQYHFSFLKKM